MNTAPIPQNPQESTSAIAAQRWQRTAFWCHLAAEVLPPIGYVLTGAAMATLLANLPPVRLSPWVPLGVAAVIAFFLSVAATVIETYAGNKAHRLTWSS
ncbi:hypothetical protein [Micromonospora sp. RV43]|uniref:hypothetical protein n=1 Tax=Micromonospora sp. RV43 TaxID=1661387 RepID=UPI00064BD3F1|nr:hypothetical protein [Micromonospora sp. RV43]